MKKLVALLLTLVMVLSLGTVVFAAGPLPLFDPELVGKDDGGMGRPAYVKLPTVKPSVKYGPDGPIPIVGAGDSEYNAIGQFAANTIATLLYQPAKNLAVALKLVGGKLEFDVNLSAAGINFAAGLVDTQTTVAADATQYVAKGIVYMGKVVYQAVCKICETPEKDDQFDHWYNHANTNASACFDFIDALHDMLTDNVDEAVEKVQNATKSSRNASYTGSVAGEKIHTFVTKAANWLLDKDNFKSLENHGDIAEYIYGLLVSKD